MDNIEFIKTLKTSPSLAMEYLYTQYYTVMCGIVYSIIKNNQAAEDIVQELFLYIWRKRENLEINTSLPAYLRQAARNRSLNYIRNQKVVVFKGEEMLELMADDHLNLEQNQSAHDLGIEIEQQIMALPEKCGIVFALSRYENMSYSEIATELDISVKTVEHQISKALKILRNNIYKTNLIKDNVLQ